MLSILGLGRRGQVAGFRGRKLRMGWRIVNKGRCCASATLRNNVLLEYYKNIEYTQKKGRLCITYKEITHHSYNV